MLARLNLRRILSRVFIFWVAIQSWSYAADPIRIATIQPLSGPFALQGEEIVKQLKGMADLLNAKGGLADGRKVEIIALDGKANAQDSLLALKQAIDLNVRYVVSNISSVVHAISDGVAKHNARNPDRRVLLINIDARDPALTEAKCNFWHFRLNYHTDTEINFLTDYLAQQPSVRKVYLINQDYAYGQAIQRASREQLPRKRKDIQVVGEDMIPLGKVKDFAPYAAKIRESGADSVVTGNWGNDMFLLVRAGHDAGLDIRYYVLVGNIAGTTAGLGNAGVGKVYSLFPWHANAETFPYANYNAEYRSTYRTVQNFDYIPAHRAVKVLAAAIDKARSDDPMKVALALESMSFEGPEGRTWIRREDHQMVTPLYLAQLTRMGEPGVRVEAENTGLGWKTVAKAESKDAVPPVKCVMERPQ
jgi:branched-chain amino acid transport system substrate-binding protein